MPELKPDAHGVIFDENENIVDDKGIIIHKKEDIDKDKTDIEGLPEHFKFLPKDKQTELLSKMSKQNKDQKLFIDGQANELGTLRKIDNEFKVFKESLAGKKPTEDELEVFLKTLESKFDADQLKDITKLMDLKGKATVKQFDSAFNQVKDTLKVILEDGLETYIQTDKDIDQEMYAEHKDEIMKEYARFKDPKTTREMKKNLKEAVLKVQKRIVSGMTKEARDKYEKKRNAAIKSIGGGIAEKGPKDTEKKGSDEEVQENILNADGKKGDGVFG